MGSRMAACCSGCAPKRLRSCFSSGEGGQCAQSGRVFPEWYSGILLNTKQKIALARVVWRVIRVGYRLSNTSVKGQYRRGQLNWSLDLDDGIDFAIFLLGHFEPRTVRFYQKRIRPGDTVLDIGANIGAHTLPLAQCVNPGGRVHAFEPTEFAYEKLLANIGLNPEIQNLIVPNHCFLSATEEEEVPAEIYSSWPLKPTPGVHPKHRGQLKPTSGAFAVTLDNYCQQHQIERVDWMKIDVDGNEFTVLQGARKNRELIAIDIDLHPVHSLNLVLLAIVVQSHGEGAGSRLKLPPMFRVNSGSGLQWPTRVNLRRDFLFLRGA